VLYYLTLLHVIRGEQLAAGNVSSKLLNHMADLFFFAHQHKATGLKPTKAVSDCNGGSILLLY